MEKNIAATNSYIVNKLKQYGKMENAAPLLPPCAQYMGGRQRPLRRGRGAHAIPSLILLYIKIICGWRIRLNLNADIFA